jgi:hypothetical protein
MIRLTKIQIESRLTGVHIIVLDAVSEYIRSPAPNKRPDFQNTLFLKIPKEKLEERRVSSKPNSQTPFKETRTPFFP